MNRLLPNRVLQKVGGLVALGLLSTLWAFGQEGGGDVAETEGIAVSQGDGAQEPRQEMADHAGEASIYTQSNARTITLSVPAPRGVILDREGQPLAQSKVGYHLALDFTALPGEHSEQEVVAWARQRLAEVGELASGVAEPSAEDIFSYYRHRRWLPWPVTKPLSQEKFEKLAKSLPRGVVPLPVYQRHYPQKSSAAHLIGYVGTRQRLPSGPINLDDPLFESTQGKAGLELIYDGSLRGSDGQKRLLYDNEGHLLLEKWVRRPRAGGSLITTLNLDWQRKAEQALRRSCERGALVLIDVNSGEVLVMASNPSYNLNDFIPGISNEAFQALLNDPARPLVARAYQGVYPPASTFKPVVTLTALNDGVVGPDTLIDCPYKIKIGHLWFRNHSKKPEGKINAKRALARSCNPWFYQVGMKTGPTSFLSVARRLGFGSTTGLPLVGEQGGLVPTNEYMLKTHGRDLTDGDTANLSIGQGVILATPLQVAQAMAGIANGGALPQLHLVRQIQDFHGRVVEAPSPEVRTPLRFTQEALEEVRQGMVNVVHAPYGTGKEGGLSFTVLAGKTGTAQWGPASKKQRLAWFAGFLPAQNPRYAFAVLYEGKPYQSVSGGKFAAPIVRRFFNSIRVDLEKNLVGPAKAMVIVEEDEDEEVPVAVPVFDDEQREPEPSGPAPRLELD